MESSKLIDNQIAGIKDWRGQMLAKLRQLIHEADPKIVEEWKWDVPVFTHKGMVCAISSFKDHIKINFFKGAQLQDPHKLINNGLESKSHRSIDFSEGDKINEPALKELINQAVILNTK
jgi:hypothetical protein